MSAADTGGHASGASADRAAGAAGAAAAGHAGNDGDDGDDGQPRLHPSAIIDPRAELDASVRVGAYAFVGAGVVLGAGTVVHHHASIEGPSVIGRDNRFHPFCSVGSAPQDMSWRGEPTRLEMGDGNTVREYVTINRGTMKQDGVTRVGSHNWIMACAHVAHDCVLGDHIVMANTVNLAGHVVVDDWVVFGGYAGVHQFCKIGAHAMVGPSSGVVHDVPPYLMVRGHPAEPHGINSEGLRRRGFSAEQNNLLRRAYKTLYRHGLRLEEARAELRAMAEAEDDGGVLAALAGFLDGVTRGIVR